MLNLVSIGSVERRDETRCNKFPSPSPLFFNAKNWKTNKFPRGHQVISSHAILCDGAMHNSKWTKKKNLILILWMARERRQDNGKYDKKDTRTCVSLSKNSFPSN